jgi:hypothetical protein
MVTPLGKSSDRLPLAGDFTTSIGRVTPCVLARAGNPRVTAITPEFGHCKSAMENLKVGHGTVSRRNTESGVEVF